MTNINETDAELAELAELSSEALAELTRRVEDISNSYRAVAEKMGQLYMAADEHSVSMLTARLDKPMRNASDNEQAFSAILEELRAQTRKRE